MKKNRFIYFSAVLAVLAIKIFYRTADSDMLLWILAPTTRWVRILSGIPFEYVAKTGYVSHEYRFIIAPSCSGVRFLLLVFLMLIFSFTARMDTARKKACWFGASVVFSYLATIFVNGIRITVSIYLPLALEERRLVSEWLTAEKLHTIIGTTVYFSMLLFIYYIAGLLCMRVSRGNMSVEADESPARRAEQLYTSKRSALSFLEPVFWYFVMVLGLPFAGRLYRGDWEGFWPYALIVTGVCVPIVLAYFISNKLRSLKG